MEDIFYRLSRNLGEFFIDNSEGKSKFLFAKLCDTL
jgi:hypothetical protein